MTHRFSIQRYEVFRNLKLIAHDHHLWRLEPFVYCKKNKSKSLLRQIEIKSKLEEKPIFFGEEAKKPNEKQISRIKPPSRTDLYLNHPRG